jgi:hypothetical protein
MRRGIAPSTNGIKSATNRVSELSFTLLRQICHVALSLVYEMMGGTQQIVFSNWLRGPAKGRFVPENIGLGRTNIVARGFAKAAMLDSFLRHLNESNE